MARRQRLFPQHQRAYALLRNWSSWVDGRLDHQVTAERGGPVLIPAAGHLVTARWPGIVAEIVAEIKAKPPRQALPARGKRLSKQEPYKYGSVYHK